MQIKHQGEQNMKYENGLYIAENDSEIEMVKKANERKIRNTARNAKKFARTHAVIIKKEISFAKKENRIFINNVTNTPVWIEKDENSWTVKYSHKGYGFNDAEAYVERGDVYKDIYKKLGVENASSWTYDEIYAAL